ncbi:bifunctional phosphopantothenoylcysteine decarboxylase/phosphopantothenate--cysteine ligase CoaBC [Candidatus Pelagibacter sp.]|nr:bifunctional phosphopantothenoylcysteine decarboxylase/phosphopantothenate--cysteine ligase CoaBC [Candidatus Pelagibacter sp.]
MHKMKNLADKKILFIICGGIAAYKSLELIRLFRKNKSSIKTILTRSAKKFVTPLSIASLSQGKVYEDLFNIENELEMDHIALSRWADVIIVAPATANTISKLASGKAEDLASTVILASNKQIYLAPAMNVRMWEHQSTKDNLKTLKNYGYKVIGPITGDMACGEYGEGKMSEPIEIFNEIQNFVENRKENKKIKALVTAGPTNEYIDPVRFISNKSSGKQGYEIAKSLHKRGFDTTLISGPTNLDIDQEIKLIKVETADEMFKATQKNLPTDIAVFSAAVSDFKIDVKSKDKIKKKERLNIKLERNVDILNYISNHNSMRPKLVIGFAAETKNLDSNAMKKLKNKNCDWIVANDVSKENIGFNSDYNEVTIHYNDLKKNKETLSHKKKSEISEEIVDRIVTHMN